MPDINPFAQVYSALWNLAESHPHFNAISPGNKIRFDGNDSNPIKDRLSATDLPEIMLRIDNTVVNLQNTSSSSEVIRTYLWQFSSGDYRYNELMADLEWAIVCAIVNWPNMLGVLKWHDKSFVKRVTLQNSQTGLSDPVLNRNINGWAAMWRSEVIMVFQTSDLLKELRCTD